MSEMLPQYSNHVTSATGRIPRPRGLLAVGFLLVLLGSWLIILEISGIDFGPSSADDFFASWCTGLFCEYLPGVWSGIIFVIVGALSVACVRKHLPLGARKTLLVANLVLTIAALLIALVLSVVCALLIPRIGSHTTFFLKSGVVMLISVILLIDLVLSSYYLKSHSECCGESTKDVDLHALPPYNSSAQQYNGNVQLEDRTKLLAEARGYNQQTPITTL